jgi:uncharacterized membrane protein
LKTQLRELIFLFLSLSFTSRVVSLISQNRSAEIDRVRESSLHEKVDHIRLSQLLRLWDSMQTQANDMQLLLRHWLAMHRRVRAHQVTVTGIGIYRMR